MAKFKFRLASLLRVREQTKDQKYWELRSLYETRRQKVVEIVSLEKELMERNPSLLEGQVITARELQLRSEHSHALGLRLNAKRAGLARFDEYLANKRTELVEAMRAVKSLEQLRQRHEERHRRAENTAEQKFGDEVAQRKFAQRRGKIFPNDGQTSSED